MIHTLRKGKYGITAFEWSMANVTGGIEQGSRVLNLNLIISNIKASRRGYRSVVNISRFSTVCPSFVKYNKNKALNKYVLPWEQTLHHFPYFKMIQILTGSLNEFSHFYFN